MSITDNIVKRYYSKTQILLKLANYFNRNLLFDQKALNYCLNRGLTKKGIDSFLIGYDINASSLQNFIEREKLDPEILINLGFLSKNEDNSYYDKFSKRIVFPVFDIKGNVMGFSGRIWKKGDTRSKYVNCALSSIYQKSLAVYGLFHSIYDILISNLVIIVEGIFDVSTCHQEGIKIAVSSCGTSFMKEHFLILRQFTNRFIFCFDNDTGGNVAIEKVKKLLNNEKGIKVGYLKIEGAKDPDEFIQKYGSEYLKSSILELEKELIFV